MLAMQTFVSGRPAILSGADISGARQPRMQPPQRIHHPVSADISGANAVWPGRAPLYGLAVAGAALALSIFREEIDRVMAMIGANTVADLNPGYLKAYVRTLRNWLPL